LIQAPLTEENLVLRKEELRHEQIYLVVYTDSITFTNHVEVGLAKEKEEIEMLRKERKKI
jgi:hypothetical protein